MMGDEHLDATERMKAYIAAHLREPITSRDLAAAAGSSQYHAARIFKSQTGMSPFEYLRKERLLGAAHALRTGETRVIDVALDFTFDSHEGFTRSFSRAFGITPKKFASRPIPEGWLVPYHYLNRSKTKASDMKESAVIFTQIVERPKRKLILKRGRDADNYFDYVKEVGCGDADTSAPWEKLMAIAEALHEPVGVWLPENMRPEGTGIYAHGVEVGDDYVGALPDGFDEIELAPSKFIVFQGEPYDDENYREAVRICVDHIGSFDPRVYGYEYAPEAAPRMQLAPQGWRGYIEMLPVRPIA